MVLARRAAGSPWLLGGGARPPSGSEAVVFYRCLCCSLFAGLFRPVERGVCKEANGISFRKQGVYLFIFREAGLSKSCCKWLPTVGHQGTPRAFDAYCRWRFVCAYSVEVRIGRPISLFLPALLSYRCYRHSQLSSRHAKTQHSDRLRLL